METQTFEGSTITATKPTSSLNKAKGLVSQQLSDLQRQMQEISARRQALEEEKEASSLRDTTSKLGADLLDASNLISGVQSQSGLQKRQELAQKEQSFQDQLNLLKQEEMTAQNLQRGLQGSEIGLLEREEEEEATFQALQSQAERQKVMGDPNSDLSRQKRQELAFLGIQVPDSFSAAQLEENKDLLIKAQERQQQRAFEDMKHQRDLQLNLLKEERDLQKQLMLSDRKDATTLAQAQKRRSEQTMEAYYNAKDAIDLVKRGGAAEKPNQATDGSLLEGYGRLLKNKATSYDDDGRPIVNKSLLDQANSQLRVWAERIRGNKGLLTPEDRRALMQEAQSLYEVEQGYNVKKLKNVVDWSNQMSQKNPNIGAGFVVPGVDLDVLEKEYQEFFPSGDTYLSSSERLSLPPTPDEEAMQSYELESLED
jgi:hypothetical protein